MAKWPHILWKWKLTVSGPSWPVRLVWLGRGTQWEVSDFLSSSFFFFFYFNFFFLSQVAFLSFTFFFFFLALAVSSLSGEGNGTPLQNSSMDGGAWWAVVHGVAKSWTWLSVFTFTFMRWRRKWQPTPVFLPGESQGQGSLVGCRPWGCTESDMTEAT